MLPSSLILALALYPFLSIAAPIAFLKIWQQKLTPTPALPSGVDDREKPTAGRLGVILPLVFYGALLCCVALWGQFSTVTWREMGFHKSGWPSSVLRGGYVGLSWAGIWLWSWMVLSAPHRLRREVPGLAAPFDKQLVVWLAGAFAEELWRVMIITGLLDAGYSATFAVVITSLAFGIAFLSGGPERSALACIEGVIFGVLFLWQRSFFAPFTAHLVVQAVYLWGIGQFSEEQRVNHFWWKRVIRCPVCKTRLTRFQIKLTEAFRCPSCHERLSVSDEYRNTMRWAGIFAYMFFFVCSLALFYEQIPESLAFWLVWPIAWGSGTSALLLYQRLFPPQVQYGDPHFVSLNLDARRPPTSEDDKDHNV